jgi:CRP-like cAMP-binding protein
MNDSYPDSPAQGMILNALPAEARASLLARGRRRSYRKGEVIFSRGDEGAWALLIEDGLVEVSVMSLAGRKSVLNHMEKGEILGEIALLDGQPRSAEAVAASDVSGIIVRREAVVAALKQNNDACFRIIETLCARARNASEMFELQSLTSGNARLARCLMRVAEKWGREDSDGSICIEQNLSQTDLGELAGIARENVNRHLQSWVQDGLIHFDKGDITLIEPEAIADFAEL